MDTLYTKDVNDKVRTWKCEISGSKYRMISGTQDGKQTASGWTQAKATNVGRSNERTPEAQAAFEVQARYEKQLKTGYATRVEDIKAWGCEPMRAAKYGSQVLPKVLWDRGFYVAQPKLNGHRCLATKDGLFTRQRERYVSVPHIEKSLAPFFEQCPDAVLDGEFYNYALRQQLNELASLVRRTKPTEADLTRSEEIVQFHVYDGWGFTERYPQGSHYRSRKDFINTLAKAYPHVYIVESTVCKSVGDFDAYYEDQLADGQEGAMLRYTLSPYRPGIRSPDLLKRKPFDDAEFRIAGIREGEGTWSGVAKIIELEDPTGVIEPFKATFKGTMEQADECLKAKETWIGKIVTIQYNGLTGLGTPNFAQFDYANCLNHN